MDITLGPLYDEYEAKDNSVNTWGLFGDNFGTTRGTTWGPLADYLGTPWVELEGCLKTTWGLLGDHTFGPLVATL